MTNLRRGERLIAHVADPTVERAFLAVLADPVLITKLDVYRAVVHDLDAYVHALASRAQFYVFKNPTER